MKRIAAVVVGFALLSLIALAIAIGCSQSRPPAKDRIGATPQAAASPVPARTKGDSDADGAIDALTAIMRSQDIRSETFTVPPGDVTERERVTPQEELWILGRHATTLPTGNPLKDPDLPQSAAPQELPGTGALMAKLPDSKQVPIPLKHTDVRASVAGYIATVDVTQQYQNPYDSKIEAVYVFPLPQNAAVHDFLMTIGNRRIRGIVRERKEAEAIYKAAKQQGYVASLLTQERPNVFTQSIANIEPGKQIDVNIKYFNTLEYVDGWYEFVFPMVVGPRFNPPGSTDGIGAKAHDAGVGATGQKTEVSYLKPTERSGHDISLALDIDAGVKIEQIDCRNHVAKIEQPELGLAKVVLDSSDAIPNKDFVLRYKVAGDKVKSGLMVQRDEKGEGGYFTLMVYPPDSLKDLPRKSLEMVFTLDVSGSMSGQPIEQSRNAIRYALQHMARNDTFQVIRFACSAEPLSPRPMPATSENVAIALKYIEVMQAGGGTMMIEGIRQSLKFTPDENRSRVVALLTDGYIGNEVEILKEIHDTRNATRIFSFGVGSSPNRFLLDNAARIGAGTVAYLGLNDDASKVMSAYFERISHPALTDINVEWGDVKVDEVYPQKMPDLFVGRPVILTGHFTGKGNGNIKLVGKVGGEVRAMELPLNIEQAANHKGLSQVSARAKIEEFSDRAIWQSDPNLPTQIKDVALSHGLMCAYTAFVAVDSSTQTAGDHGTTVAVPVPVPDGVKYETTVQEK